MHATRSNRVNDCMLLRSDDGTIFMCVVCLCFLSYWTLAVVSFGSIAALVESAGSAFQPFVLKLVQAVSDGMRECVFLMG